MSVGTRLLLSALALSLSSSTLSFPPALLGASHAAPAPPFQQFRFSTHARRELRVLWSTSIDAHAERVACIAGTVEDGVARISLVQPVDAATRDSTQAGAATSVAVCHPPQWIGTVHTHVATFGGLPFVTFSAPDRDVIWRWQRQWQAEGIFCVVYSSTRAHCESGNRMSGEPTYAGDGENEE